MEPTSAKLLSGHSELLLHQILSSTKHGGALLDGLTLGDGGITGGGSGGGTQPGLGHGGYPDIQNVAKAFASSINGSMTAQQYHTATASYTTPNGRIIILHYNLIFLRMLVSSYYPSLSVLRVPINKH